MAKVEIGKYSRKLHWSWMRGDKVRTRCGHWLPPSAIADTLDEVTCGSCRRSLGLSGEGQERQVLAVEVRTPQAEHAASMVCGSVKPAKGSRAFKVVEVDTNAFDGTEALIDFLHGEGIRAWHVPPM